MPLTAKGEKILSAMQEQYGEEKGKSVLYAAKNAGTITGIDSKLGYTGDDSPVSALPSSVTAKTINEQNRKYWEQLGPQADKK